MQRVIKYYTSKFNEIKNNIYFNIYIIDFYSQLSHFKFDKYEKSTDNKSNHSLIKGDVHKFWVEADKIKKNFQDDKPIYDFGGVFWNSYLPPKFIAFLYSYRRRSLY